MLVTWALPQAGEQGDIRNFLPTAQARELLVRLGELSGRSLVLSSTDGEEVCRSDDRGGALFFGGRGAAAPIEPSGHRVGHLHVMGADAEGAAGQNLARLLAACVADRVIASVVALRSPFSVPAGCEQDELERDADADLRRILELTAAQTGAETVSILRLRAQPLGHAGGDLLELTAALGVETGPNLVLRAASGPLREALDSPEPFEIQTRKHELGMLEMLLGRGQLLLAPMRVDGRRRVEGLLTAGNPTGGAFREDNLSALPQLASLAANVLDRTGRLEDGHRHLVHAIQAILETVEGGDGLRGHCTRTARHATLVGRSMALSEGRLRDLELAASLHDLGKIGTCDLRASQVAEQHAEWGAALLETATAFAHLAPAVRFHHARWDGAGTNGERRGEDLPLAARIIAVCDALDHQMAPTAGGMKGRSLGAALCALEAQEGAFDPAVMAALRRLEERTE